MTFVEIKCLLTKMNFSNHLKKKKEKELRAKSKKNELKLKLRVITFCPHELHLHETFPT
jgi:hypothetical protein